MSIVENDKQSQSIGVKVIRGGLWVFGLRIASQLMRFATLIVLARLLVPEDFGLLGITLLTLAVLEVFSTTGFREALVQKSGDTEQFINTAWTVHAIRGVILYGLLYFAAPFVADFFDSPAVTPLLQVAGVSLVLRGFSNIRVLYFQKELRFSKEFIYQITGSLVQVGLSVSLALMYRSVWALVLGHVAGEFTRFIFSYILARQSPSFDFNRVYFKEMFTFGKWIFGSSILLFLITRGDHAFVGKLLGATALGFYQLASRISDLPTTEITYVISQVTFPAYSRMQDDIPRLREAYLRVLQLTTFLSFPIAGMIIVLGGDFTRLFLGEKWLPMVPAMQVLALAGMIRSVAATTGPIFHATGKPKVGTIFQLVRLAVLVAAIYHLSVSHGILGTSIAVCISILVSTVGFAAMAMRITGVRIVQFAKMVVIPSLSVLIMILCIHFLKGSVQTVEFPRFTFHVCLCISVYFAIILLVNGVSHYRIGFLMKQTLALARNK